MSKKYNNYRRRQLPIVEIRTCLRCGKKFDINALQKQKRYCDECKEIHLSEHLKSPEMKRKNAEYQKQYREKQKSSYAHKRHMITCVRCGDEFMAGSGRQPTVCISCLSKSNNAAERARASVRRDYNADKRIRLSG